MEYHSNRNKWTTPTESATQQQNLRVREGVIQCNGLANQGDSQSSALLPDDGTWKCAETRRTGIQISYFTESVSKVGIIIHCVVYDRGTWRIKLRHKIVRGVFSVF